MRKLLAGAATLIALAACTFTASPASAADSPYDVLIFSKTAGFRHDAIPAGIQTIRELGAANSFSVTATEDSALFNATDLARYEAVVFLNTSITAQLMSHHDGQPPATMAAGVLASLAGSATGLAGGIALSGSAQASLAGARRARIGTPMVLCTVLLAAAIALAAGLGLAARSRRIRPARR